MARRQLTWDPSLATLLGAAGSGENTAVVLGKERQGSYPGHSASSSYLYLKSGDP